MRPFVMSIFLATLLVQAAGAGFVIRLESKELLPNTPDQMVNVYLRFDPTYLGADAPENYTAKVRQVSIGAYFGTQAQVLTVLGSGDPTLHRGVAGNFEKSSPEFPDGIEKGPLWRSEDLLDIPLPNFGTDVAQATFRTPDVPRAIIFRELSAEAHVATFHIDTTGIFRGTLTISFQDQNDFIKYNYRNSSFIDTLVFGENPLLPGTTMEFPMSDANLLRVEGGNFQIASTPEPSVIGFAGLSLTAGFGWLRARARRRKSAG